MTSQPDESHDPVAAAQDLTRGVAALAYEVKRLRTYGRRNRVFIVFDVLLTVLLSGVGVISVHAVQSAGQANTAQLALCQAGNVARAQQVQLWDYVLALPPAKGSPPPTAAQKARVAAFREYLTRDFAPRDCTALVNGKHSG